MKVIASSLALTLIAHTTLACVNITGTKYDGGAAPKTGHRALVLRKSISVNMQSEGRDMEHRLYHETNFNDRSDYSVALMYIGHYSEAVELLNKLEAEKPGQYFIAANLGTAYELAGNNEAALHWIQEGVRRNPDSHEGTEWLHARILETEIAQQKDINYFKTHTVLDLKPEEISPEITVAGKTFTPSQLGDNIEHQLMERMKFVKPPNPAVAGLLFDLAAVEARSRTLESAEAILSLAEQYGYPLEHIQPLRQLYDHRIAWRKTRQYAFYTFLVALGFLALWFLYKKGILVISRRDLKRTR